MNDDSYITLTYAKNLARGDGFIYNHPPATLGTTTPLFTLLIALLTWSVAWVAPMLDAADMAILVSVGAWVVSAPLLFAILRKAGMHRVEAMLAPAILLFMVRPWMFYIGMEIWLFQALMLLAIYLWWAERPLAAGICVGLLTLTRGEGILWAGIVGGYYLWKTPRSLLPFIVGGGAVALAWIAYAWPTFGTVVPNTLAAKQAQAALPSGSSFLLRLWNDLWNYVSSLRMVPVDSARGLNAVWFLVPLGAAAMVKWRSLLVFLVWVVVYVAAYALLDPNPYSWYVLHLEFVLHLLCGLGLAALVWIARTRRQVMSRIALTISVVLLAVGLLATDLRFMLQDVRHFEGDGRAPSYRQLTGWLLQHTEPTESVAYIEIGYLGYFTENRIVDLAGLIDPVVTEQLAEHGYTWGFRHYEPDYYIHNILFNWALGELATELENYVEVYQVATVSAGSAQVPIAVLRRKSDDRSLLVPELPAIHHSSN